MELESAPVSPAPSEPMDREPREAAQQAEGGDQEESRRELRSFTNEDGLEREGDRTLTWAHQPDRPEGMDPESKKGMGAEPFKRILRAIEKRAEGARGDGPWSREEREEEIFFKAQKGVQWETPTVRSRDQEYKSRGEQTSWPTSQGQPGEPKSLEEFNEIKMRTLIEQIQILMAQGQANQIQVGPTPEGPHNGPWGLPQPQQGVPVQSPYNNSGGDPTMGQAGIGTPGQQGVTFMSSPVGGGPSPMPRQAADTPGRASLPPQGPYTPAQSYVPQQLPDTPAQGRRDSWDGPMRGRSANEDCQSRTPGSRSTPYARESYQGRRTIMPERYDGTTVELREYLNQFLVLTELNNWSEEEKGLYLASRLTGVARGILNDMAPGERTNFESLTQKLQERFEPACREEAFRAELRIRQRKRSETPSEFGHAVKNLVTKAYPDLNEKAKETIALEAYWNGHPEGEMRVMALMKAPRTVEEASGFVTQYESVKPVPTGKRVSRPINLLQAEEEEGSSKWNQMADMLIGAVYNNKPNEGATSANRSSDGKWPNRNGNGTTWKKDQPNRPSLASVLTTALKKALEDPLKKLDGVMELLQRLQGDKRKLGTEKDPTEKESSGPSNNKDPKKAWNSNRRSPNPATGDTECWRCKTKGHYARDCPIKAQVCATMMEWIMKSDDPEMVAPAPEPEEEEDEQESTVQALLENYRVL